MANLNISIDLTKLPGAKVMDVEGKTQTKRCVVIPIDDHVGTVCEGYLSQNPDGTPTMKSFDEVKLQVVAIEYRQKKHGISHGLKPSFSQQYQERMTEEIANAVMAESGAEGVGVVIKAKHLCMMMRGVEKQNSEMTTSAVLGSFRSDEKVRQEFLSLIG